MVEKAAIPRFRNFLSLEPIAKDRSSYVLVWLLFCAPMLVNVAVASFFSERSLFGEMLVGFVVSVVEFPFAIAVVYGVRILLPDVPRHGILVAAMLASGALNTALAFIVQIARIA